MASSTTAFLRAGAAALVCALATGLWPGGAGAAHPTLTEDTGTQGRGRFELELGFERARDGGTRDAELGAQLSCGVTDDLDLIVRPAWLDRRGERASARGAADTALDNQVALA